MPLHLRVELPDGPGALAQVTRALAAADADVLSVHVVDRAAGRATDDFLLAWPSEAGLDRLRSALAALPTGHRLLALRRVVAVPDENPALDLLTGALAQPQRSVETLVDMVPAATAADWAAIVARGTTASPGYTRAGGPSTPPAQRGPRHDSEPGLHQRGGTATAAGAAGRPAAPGLPAARGGAAGERAAARN